MTHIDYVSMTCSIPYVRQIILKAIYQVSLIKIIPIWITFLLPYHWLRGIANARSFSYWHGKSDHILSLHRKLCVCVCVYVYSTLNSMFSKNHLHCLTPVIFCSLVFVQGLLTKQLSSPPYCHQSRDLYWLFMGSTWPSVLNIYLEAALLM